MIFLSLATATKMFMAGFGLLLTLCLFLIFIAFLTKDKGFLSFYYYLPVFALVYSVFYLVYFLKGKTVVDFINFHLWIRQFAWVKIPNYPKGEIFNILIRGRWQTWWGTFERIKIKQWTPLWPLSLIASLFLGLAGLVKKGYSQLLLVVWVFSFLGMYTLGVPYPRYLLPILPPLYIILIYIVKSLSPIIRTWLKRNL